MGRPIRPDEGRVMKTMTTTYSCDRCGTNLADSDEQALAHRQKQLASLKAARDEQYRGMNLGPPHALPLPVEYAIGLYDRLGYGSMEFCDACLRGFVEWLKGGHQGCD